MINMKVTVEKEEMLGALKDNRANHARIVEESRVGYIEEAKKVIEEKLEDLKAGKATSLQFALTPPQDYTSTYDTAIKMLEMHTGDGIELTAGEVRNLVMDEWDWMENFLLSNSAYSRAARVYAESKGY
jgi:hypothetical protein